MRPIERYQLKKDLKGHERVVKTLVDRVENLNSWIFSRHAEVQRLQSELTAEMNKLTEYLQERREIIKTLEELGVFEKKKIIEAENISPSERVNSIHEIEILNEEAWKEKEEKERKVKEANANKEN